LALDEQFQDPARQHSTLFFRCACGHSGFEVFSQELDAAWVEWLGLGLQEDVDLGEFVFEFIFLGFQCGQFVKQGWGVATLDDGIGQTGNLLVQVLQPGIQFLAAGREFAAGTVVLGRMRSALVE
jgi:hypothetical protein